MNEESFRPVSAFRRYLVFALIILFGYLFQVCVIPYIRIMNVTPNLLLALLGILTVTYGKLRTFWAGCIFGLLTEIMCPSVSYVNLALYPIVGLFCSFAFADKPKSSNETETTLAAFFRRPWIRTLLCAFFNALIHESIRLIYVSINGTLLTSAHFTRGIASVMSTVLLTLILTGPLRLLIHPRKKYRHRDEDPTETENDLRGAVDISEL